MKILCVAVHWAPAWIEGGATLGNWNMVRGLALAGARIEVVTTDAFLGRGRRVPPEREESGVRIRTVPVLSGLGRAAHRFGLAPGLARAVSHAARQAEVCLIHGLWAWPGVVAPPICIRRSLPYVLIARGTLERISLAEKALKKRLFMRVYAGRVLRRAAAVQFVSEQEQANSRAALKATPALVGPHGFDPVEVRPRDGAGLRRRLGLGDDSVLVGLAGRIHPRKGFRAILPALRGCPEHVHLVAFGQDLEDHLRVVRGQAQDLGVAHRFHALGHLEGDELQAAYASIDLLALPSFGESFGNVVIEALLQGTEVMLSDAVALADFVRDQRLGRVVRGHDPHDWAAALNGWIREATPFDRARAVRLARESFGLAARGRQLLADLERLLRRPV